MLVLRMPSLHYLQVCCMHRILRCDLDNLRSSGRQQIFQLCSRHAAGSTSLSVQHLHLREVSTDVGASEVILLCVCYIETYTSSLHCMRTHVHVSVHLCHCLSAKSLQGSSYSYVHSSARWLARCLFNMVHSCAILPAMNRTSRVKAPLSTSRILAL